MIAYDREKGLLTIHTKNSTYQMKTDKYGVLLHTYYGRRADGDMSYLFMMEDRGFSGSIYDARADRTYSLDQLPQEYPSSGTGDFRSPALIIEGKNGAAGCDLRFDSCKIREGKYALEGLPAVYADAGEDRAQTLEIHMKDRYSKLEVVLLYGVLPELDIITRSAVIQNLNDEGIVVQRALSASLDFLTGEFDLITFHGRHGMERQLERQRVNHSAHVIGSRRGMSSHQYNPLMILADKECCEEHGSCYAMEFVYSGGFFGLSERDQYDQTRMQMGMMDEKFSYPLAKGESLILPEVILSYSGEGLTRLSQNLQDCLRLHVCRGRYRDSVRPVLLNSWEACYMNFDGEKILGLAREAASLGIDMLVLDDGWFENRNDDNGGLGDWLVDEKKLGTTLGELIRDIHEAGVRFGIWMEPEMVSEDSALYREHRDWAMRLPGREPVLGRNQLVLDLSRKEVVDYLFDRICGILDQGEVDYLKWDYNRSISDVYSHGAELQGKVLYDYMLGLYSLLERLLERYPDLLIEGCSGGGGRFDAGMLYYTPQIWCSDNTDAIDRLKIQYGTSFGYPMSSIGAHVSAVPNEQNGRITALWTRGVVAMTGGFGYELDPGLLSDGEKKEIREQVALWKKHAALIMEGKYYRLSSPFDDALCAWSFVSRDQEEVILNVVCLETHCNMPGIYVRLRGLKSGAMYSDTAGGGVYSSGALMEAGYPVPRPEGEYIALQRHFKIVH